MVSRAWERWLPVLVAIGLCSLPERLWAAEPARAIDLADASKWPLDAVHLRDGTVYRGLIQSEDETALRMLQVVRPEGRRTHSFVRRVPKSEILSIKRIDATARREVQSRLDLLKKRAASEQELMAEVELTRAGDGMWSFKGEFFDFSSTASEEISRRAIVRMEQVFASFREMLPPRQESRRPLQMLLFGSSVQYRAFLQKIGLRIDNPAFFSAEHNVVVTASDLDPLETQLAAIRAQHDALRDRCQELSKIVNERVAAQAQKLREQGVPAAEVRSLAARTRRELQEEIDGQRKQLDAFDRKNKTLFEQATQQMFATLYHESFHAYLDNYVYPHQRCETPRWLNEGLAQVFECGVLEAGQLRVDAPNAALLKKLREDLRGSEPLRLADLLTADHRGFLVAHGSSAQTSNRHYTYAWGLAHYLAFHHKRLGTPALDAFVTPPAAGDDAVARFEKLVGLPLPAFEKQWREKMLAGP